MTKSLIIIAHNIRSSHNIGSLLRTCDGLGVTKVYLTGYTPYPKHKADSRLPHIAQRVHDQIKKTALGAEESINWRYTSDLHTLIHDLKQDGYTLAALEQAKNSTALPDFQPPHKLAILLGNEVEGVTSDLQKTVDLTLEIPMFGKKESFNVVEASTMAMYHWRFSS